MRASAACSLFIACGFEREMERAEIAQFAARVALDGGNPHWRNRRIAQSWSSIHRRFIARTRPGRVQRQKEGQR